MNFEELCLNNSSHKIHNQYWQQTPREDSLWELLIVLKKIDLKGLPRLKTGATVQSVV
ncbi:MAG: hypothetical protein GVY20_03185 [Bacteroidetes bacterium]|jgi:hypothetical protein|nr:hypothetical protein [Bacteroidota bacterium]